MNLSNGVIMYIITEKAVTYPLRNLNFPLNTGRGREILRSACIRQ